MACNLFHSIFFSSIVRKACASRHDGPPLNSPPEYPLLWCSRIIYNRPSIKQGCFARPPIKHECFARPPTKHHIQYNTGCLIAACSKLCSIICGGADWHHWQDVAAIYFLYQPIVVKWVTRPRTVNICMYIYTYIFIYVCVCLPWYVSHDLGAPWIYICIYI